MAFANDNYNRNKNVNGYTDTGTGYKPNVVKTPTTTYVQPHGSDNYYVGQNKDGYVYYGGNTNNNNNTRSNNSISQVSAPSNGIADYWNALLSALQAQKDKADAYYKTLYEQALAKNAQADREGKDEANLMRARTDRYLNQLYGVVRDNAGATKAMNVPPVGTGLRARSTNYQNWNKNIATLSRAKSDADLMSLAEYQRNLANSQSEYNQSYLNALLSRSA